MSKYKVLRAGEDNLVIDGVPYDLDTIIELSDETASAFVDEGKLELVEETFEDEIVPTEEADEEDGVLEDEQPEEETPSEDAASEDAVPAGDDVTPAE